MIRTFIFLVGFGLTTIGFTYIISYLNLISFGYNFSEYVNFICRKTECIMTFLGIIMIFLAIFIPKGDNKSELYI